MDTTRFTRERLEAVLAEVSNLQESEFPYDHSKKALKRIELIFRERLSGLDGAIAKYDPECVEQECAVALADISNYLPLLGFILRSTNVRNSFEIVGPLLHMCNEVLEPGVPIEKSRIALVLSSEWDYSPFVYQSVPELAGFVLIGLPASESNNPLVVPLAGHELGHSLWERKGVGKRIKTMVQNTLVRVIGGSRQNWDECKSIFRISEGTDPAKLGDDLFFLEVWQPIKPWVEKQFEETFCDFIGLRLFGSAFLNAFAYLLAPRSALPRSIRYPSMSNRVRNLKLAAQDYDIAVPDDYEKLFGASQQPELTQADEFRLRMADEAILELAPRIMQMAKESCPHCTISHSDEVKRIEARMRQVVPAEKTRSISDILNAAWNLNNDPELWRDFPEISKKRDVVLRELTLKNIEILEIEQILVRP